MSLLTYNYQYWAASWEKGAECLLQKMLISDKPVQIMQDDLAFTKRQIFGAGLIESICRWQIKRW